GAPLTPAEDEGDETLPAHAGMRGLFQQDRRHGSALAGKLRELAAQGPAILVGWGAADALGARPETYHLRLVARREDRIRRLSLRTDSAPETAARLVDESDGHRAEFHRRLFGADWRDVRRHHLVLNTSLLAVEAATDLACRCIGSATGGGNGPAAGAWRCVTISRQFGAGGRELAELLATTLGWPLHDRDMLQQSGSLSGIALPELMRVDERGPEFLERLHLMQDSARYFEALREALVRAAGGPAILVGRGGNMLVPSDAALHLRLVADDADRVERVMRRRWLAAGAAEALMHEEDRHRADFHRHFFRADWSDPTLYHLTCSSSRLPLPGVATALSGFLGAGERPAR
ncbi:MAG: cytidylate kinase family protein, partial [Armatimonadetes bacterium]|nr:cytidylate kinase family protein [Armatimonadota bacterium]